MCFQAPVHCRVLEALASGGAPWPGVANWESLTGNSFAFYQPQDVNPVEMWRPLQGAEETGPSDQGSGHLGNLSVHQILKLTLPISVLGRLVPATHPPPTWSP